MRSPTRWRTETNWKRLIVVALFSFVCVAAVSFGLLWQFEENVVARQQAGEVALADWMAPKSHTYASSVKTRELGDEAANNIANRVYKRDTALVVRERENLSNLLNQLSAARATSLNGVNPAVWQVDPIIAAAGLEPRQLTAILNLPELAWSQITQEARTAYSIIMNRDILPGDRANFLAVLRNAVYAPYTLSGTFALLDEPNRELTLALVKPFVKENNILDEGATRKKQEEARSQSGPATVDIRKGTAIVRRGDVLTALQIEQLKELGLRSNTPSVGTVVGTVGMVALLVLLLVVYCSLLSVQVLTSPRWLLFIGMAIIVSALAMRILIVDAGRDSYRPYLLPLAAVALVIAALFDVHLALFLSSLLALLAGTISGTPELAAVFLAGSAAGAMVIRKAESTSVFAYAGIVVAIAQFLTTLCAILLTRSLESANLTTLVFYSSLNGLFSASLAFLCFSVLGKLFGVATVLQLLELAHPNQPLLRRLIREAPGTYHHSVMVGNLAEQAAERIEDNALLARVGAYYHDIGKLARPGSFIDNQGGGTNIHDTLDPRESMRIIRAHVPDGVVLARKHNLPRRVVDIIHQHHGTCTISYFYQKALKMGLDVNELDFRYPGPKPQTKVAAIVMLADGCEAAVRANVQSGRIPTGKPATSAAVDSAGLAPASRPLSIKEVVDKIIDDRVRDNQLNECDLTLRDVEIIRTLFVEILNGIYHPRIAYPENVAAVAQPGVITPVTVTTVVTAEAREVESDLEIVTPRSTTPLPLATMAEAADSGADSLSDQNLVVAASDTSPGLEPARRGIGEAGRPLSKS